MKPCLILFSLLLLISGCTKQEDKWGFSFDVPEGWVEEAVEIEGVLFKAPDKKAIVAATFTSADGLDLESVNGKLSKDMSDTLKALTESSEGETENFKLINSGTTRFQGNVVAELHYTGESKDDRGLHPEINGVRDNRILLLSHPTLPSRLFILAFTCKEGEAKKYKAAFDKAENSWKWHDYARANGEAGL